MLPRDELEEGQNNLQVIYKNKDNLVNIKNSVTHCQTENNNHKSLKLPYSASLEKNPLQ